jgi:hypothetical protein
MSKMTLLVNLARSPTRLQQKLCKELKADKTYTQKQLAVMLGVRIQEGQKAGLIETRGKPEKMSDRLTLLDIVPTRDYASRCYKLGRITRRRSRRTCDLKCHYLGRQCFPTIPNIGV